ncbi:c-type cytochrome [Desulfovibrio intestinalis]|uniref:Mono/diheme cytochrome c family protein n=1 Tax=Desulfovibrio intestinalis TaxID=58621 RepID=A0A7W8C2R1_9BACT|nr:c-type cytochrome [Desulfovibrio intestinalis]MBB5144256.1 mono/diheme cytochrome c family protein [Desulfovibrio intestinalis]
MNKWTDLFLLHPLSDGWLDGLLFVTFGLHLLFALLIVGTAVLGLVFFLQDWLNNDQPGQSWNSKFMHTHLGLKSLAVVLGIAPLLLIQIRYSYSFFTTTGLFAYAWLAVIPLLIVAFLLIDGFNHSMESRSWLALLCGVIGVGALLTVPAVFTGALALMERQHLWAQFGQSGGQDFATLPALAPHWLLRYLHVIGAALVLGAAFQLFFSTRNNPEKAPRLRNWVFGATLAQILIGIPLLFTVAAELTWTIVAALTVGALAALLVLWVLRPRQSASEAAPRPVPLPAPRSLLWLLPLAFAAMLVGRQFIQDESLNPLQAANDAYRTERAKTMDPFRQPSLDAYALKLKTVYDNGDTIYDQACAPCHGLEGKGDGPVAARLLIPAEDIAAIRADREYVYTLVRDGVPGSGMPYFRLYDREKIEMVLDTMGKRFDMYGKADVPPDREPEGEAMFVWAETCSVCHGVAGEITEFGHTLLPPPPDLQKFAMTHARALEVITNGYPGTVMPPFRHLPQEVLEDLTIISNTFRVEK